jgi:16S rRNA (cytidine1402-2'-O)-methyltransferase
VTVARELTKIHEEFLRGTVGFARQELASRDRIRGEITLLIEAQPHSQAGTQLADSGREKISDRVAHIQAEMGVDEKDALKRLARDSGRSKSELYRELQRERARR